MVIFTKEFCIYADRAGVMATIRILFIYFILISLLNSCKFNTDISLSDSISQPTQEPVIQPAPGLEPPIIDPTPLDPIISFVVEDQPDGSGTGPNLLNITLSSTQSLYLIKRSDGSFVEKIDDVEWQLVGVSDTSASMTQTVDQFDIIANDAGSFELRVIASELTEEMVLPVSVTPEPETFNEVFFGLALPDVTTLLDSTLPATIDGTTYTRTNPYSGKTITVDGSATWSNSSNIFVRADTLHFQNNALIQGDGKNYVSNTAGGAGGSGGGAPTGCGGTAGAGGSSGGDGSNASGGTCMGSPGTGYGTTYSIGYTDYGLGGDGGKGSNSAKGTGSIAAGGGGGATYNLWGGGGGGGGLVVILANAITGHGFIRSQGGNGRHGSYSVADSPGGGGGGVIFIATKEYDGNLQTSTQGGKTNGGLGFTGQTGTSRIFQIMPDDSLIERNFVDQWDTLGNYTANLSLLPYNNNNLTAPASLPDQTLTDTNLDGYIYTKINPYSANNLTISGILSYSALKPSAIFLRAKNLIFDPSSSIQANGGNGHDGHYGGSGGNGGAGGTGCGTTGKQDVGSGGIDGPPGGGTCARGGGAGWGAFYSSGFFYGFGGRGGNSDIGLGGLGSNGAGGGGHATNNLWGGGGGGGGLIVIVADDISGAGQLNAKGGDRNGSVNVNGAGGGGVIWIATKTYSGELTIDVSAGIANGSGSTSGTAKIFKIETDGSLTEKDFADSF